ncbi:Z1 domain-containing protein [Arthrobacter sp. KNU40]|uniref:Z1 domain-containing protein n=1 Tax=Arthrobacter sp. KNU40 TaxID=3447965 RepID=UPI003F61E324
MTSHAAADPTAIRSQMEKLETVVSALLSGDTYSESHLRDQLEAFRPVVAPDVSNNEIAAVHRRLVSKLSIDVEIGVGITDKDFKSWLPEKRHDIEWIRWLTYKQWLRNSNRSPRVLEKMEEFTDTILDYVGDPNLPGSWDRKGLIIGDVQSGKTQTYLGLLNKAADAGYRLIVLLAGNTEYLRQQTQNRVDEGFLGKDSSRNIARSGTSLPADRYVGVGRLNKELTYATGMTTVVQDFLQASRDATSITVPAESPNPFIFVIKKNVHVLKALIDWTDEQPKSHGKINLPLLLVDDESDYASVNTGKEDDPTQTNLLIRQLLSKYSRSSYVAITATPFANILIDHEAEAEKDGETHKDLFPKDFIYGLEAPSNYVGSVKTFGTEDDVNGDKVIELHDAEALLPLKHKQVHPLTEIPGSLKTAVRVFVVANAIRDLRGQGDQARAMLINISRFKRIHMHIYDLVKHELDSIQNALEAHAILYTEGIQNEIIDSLKAAFTDFYSETEFTWTEILDILTSAASEITVRTFNSETDKLLKEQGKSADIPKRVIAIGGDVLSRGLTLEGLMITYFHRNVRAADTMMQMARWFGYRDDFEDICRIWIDPGVAADYRFIAEAVDELRDDLRLMRRQLLTPWDFGLAIRMHPGALLITAKNKSKAAAVKPKSISLIGRRIETSRLDSAADVVGGNREAALRLAEKLVESHGDPGETQRGYPRFTNVPQSVVAGFLGEYAAHKMDELFFGNAIGRFVRSNKHPRFASWDVVFVNGTRTLDGECSFGGVTIYPPQRAVTIGSSGELLVSGKSSRLAGGDDLRKILEPAVDAEATAKFRQENPNKALTESPFYASLERPALLIYVLRPDTSKLSEADKQKVEHLENQQVVGIKVAFPGNRIDVNNRDGDVEYLINTVAQQQWFVEYSGADEDDDV